VKLLGILGLFLAVTASAQGPSWTLTPSGWGPAHIGMNRAQLSKALHVGLEGDAFDNEGSCIELYAADNALPGLIFMLIDGKLARITVTEPGKVVTPRGIGIGSSADDVRKAYGSDLKAETHHYDGEPAEYLTYWLKPEKSGVRFETDTSRRVQTIHAGNDAIQYIEGCA
jgi:hypothetical protein